MFTSARALYLALIMMHASLCSRQLHRPTQDQDTARHACDERGGSLQLLGAWAPALDCFSGFPIEK